MLYRELDIKNKDSLEYATAILYAHEDTDAIELHKRPVIIICPGGGYNHTSDRESEMIALQFMAMGYHAVVLRYSCSPALYPTALLELAQTVVQVRRHVVEWNIDNDKVMIMGFSAGAHLASCFCTFYEQPFISDAIGCDKKELRPDGQILCYPVITAGEHAHEDSFRKLLGDSYDDKKDELSLEKHVNASVPRTFVWHTYEDKTVPVQNSLLYVNALAAQGIPVEYHLFEKGRHGLSLGSRLTSGEGDREVEPSVEPWIELVHTWIGRL